MKTRTYSYLHLQSTNIADIILKLVIDRLPLMYLFEKVNDSEKCYGNSQRNENTRLLCLQTY